MRLGRRWLEPRLVAALADTPVVFLTGARQTGKSTLGQALVRQSRGRRYVTFDDLATLASARADPDGFVRALTGPVVVDEIQRAPEVYLPIKAAVDRERRAGRFLLTGAAHAMVLPELADALVGRMQILTLWPLSQGELAGARETFIETVFGSRLPRRPRRCPSVGSSTVCSSAATRKPSRGAARVDRRHDAGNGCADT